nr:hypothetical protein [Tanacetum cinerariifolium]
MSTLKFAKVHNLVAFLSKPTAKTINGEVQLQALVDGKKILMTESTVRRDIQLEDTEGVDCLPTAAIFEQVTLIGFVQVFLNNQPEGMSNHNRIYVTPSHTKKIFGNMRKVGKDFSGRETPLFPTMMVQAQEEMGEVHVADEAVNKEMDNSLERAATTATSLDAECQETMGDTVAQTRSERVSKISNDPLLTGVNTPRSVRVKSSKDKVLGEVDASKQGRIADINANKDIYLVNVHNDEDMFGVNDLDGDEVIVENVDVAEQAKEVVADITLAKALMEIKSAKPKADKVVIQEPEQGTTSITPITITTASSRPKAKGLVIHEQELAPTSTVSSQAEEKRNIPPTSAQQRSIMCTYLKNIKGWKLKSLKNKSFANIQEMSDKAMKRVNTFVDYGTELVLESSKKAKAELIEDDGDDVTVDATTLSSKSPIIVDYKIYKERRKSYF